MKVKYTPVAHDGEHTMEQQMLLLAKAAYRVWDSWFRMRDMETNPSGNSIVDNAAMRELYKQCYQTDVFMGGVHHGEDKS